MSTWVEEAIFYHIYPLQFYGAPLINTGDASETAKSMISATSKKDLNLWTKITAKGSQKPHGLYFHLIFANFK